MGSKQSNHSSIAEYTPRASIANSFPFCADLFHSLPVDVVRERILPHLSLRDLKALDSAYTNKYFRQLLCALFESYTFAIPDTTTLPLFQVQWLVGRHITIANLSVYLNRRTLSTVMNYVSTRISSLRSLITIPEDGVLLNDDNIVQLAQGCMQLEEFKVSKGTYTDVGITALAQHCKPLHTIYLNSSYISDHAIDAICNKCTNLKHIKLIACTQLTNASLLAISSAYPKLQSIGLSQCTFTDAALLALAEKCHEIKSIRVGDAVTITAAAALWTANPHLGEFCAHKFMTNDHVSQLLLLCRDLYSLELCACLGVTDASVITIAQQCGQLSKLTINYCGRITDDALMALGQHSDKLKHLELSSAPHITDVGVTALAEGCPLLQSFYVFDAKFTESGIMALATRCRDLRAFSTNSTCLSVPSISRIAANCPLLSELSFYRSNVDNAGLSAIAQHCRNLITLELHCCANVSYNGVSAILQSCQQLQMTDLSLCRCITKSDIDRLVAKFPNVSIYYLDKLERLKHST